METTRTFLAVAIDPEPRRALARLIEKLRGHAPGIRWVTPENFHFTLAFLGEVETIGLGDLADSVAEVCRRHPSFEISIAGIGAFPNLKRPRILTVGLTTGRSELSQLQADLSEMLAISGFRTEDRAFVPHLTIGRVRDNPGKSRMGESTLEGFRDWRGGTSQVGSVLVMGSELGPKGPRYSVLGTCPLAD